MRLVLLLCTLVHCFLVPFVKHSALLKRDTLTNHLSADGTRYYVQLKIGGQDAKLVLDTGSSDTWIASSEGTCALKEGGPCQVFDPSKSSSFSANQSSNFNISYGLTGEIGARGYYAQDSIEIGSATVTGANFAVATRTNNEPIVGVGPIGIEASWYSFYKRTSATDNTLVNKGGVKYDNLPVQLYKQGITTSSAYSIWLGNPVHFSGSILFGGIDTGKYKGNLYTFPIERENWGIVDNKPTGSYPDVTRFLVLVDKISLNIGSSSQEIFSGPWPALLDTGASMSYFSPEVAQSFLSVFGATESTEEIGCGVPNGNITITIRGQDFYVPLSIFIKTVHDHAGNEWVTTSGAVACWPGIGMNRANAAYFILGDNVLSALYLVFDAENEEISIAQANLDASNDDDSGIVSIQGSVPSATKAPGYSTAVSTYARNFASSISLKPTIYAVTSISGDVATRTTANFKVAGQTVSASRSSTSTSSTSTSSTSTSSTSTSSSISSTSTRISSTTRTSTTSSGTTSNTRPSTTSASAILSNPLSTSTNVDTDAVSSSQSGTNAASKVKGSTAIVSLLTILLLL